MALSRAWSFGTLPNSENPPKFGRQYADCAMTMPIPNSVTMATLTRRPVQPRSRNAAGRLKTSTANSS